MTGGVSAVAIGASAGAVKALLSILPALPRNFPFPVFIVVHVPPDRDNALVPLLASKCTLPVKEAEDKELVVGGVIYFAPADYHLLVEEDRSLALSSDEHVNHSRPAIDVLFETAADAYGPELIAMILTGANQDGAAGLSAVSEAGGRVIIEDPSTAETSAMPAAALEACPDAEILDIEGIVSMLARLGR